MHRRATLSLISPEDVLAVSCCAAGSSRCWEQLPCSCCWQSGVTVPGVICCLALFDRALFPPAGMKWCQDFCLCWPDPKLLFSCLFALLSIRFLLLVGIFCPQSRHFLSPDPALGSYAVCICDHWDMKWDWCKRRFSQKYMNPLFSSQLLHEMLPRWQLSSFPLSCGRTWRWLCEHSAGSCFLECTLAFILCLGKMDVSCCHSLGRVKGMCLQLLQPYLSVSGWWATLWPDKSGGTGRLSPVCPRLYLSFLLSIYVCMRGFIGQACLASCHGIGLLQVAPTCPEAGAARAIPWAVLAAPAT